MKVRAWNETLAKCVGGCGGRGRPVTPALHISFFFFLRLMSKIPQLGSHAIFPQVAEEVEVCFGDGVERLTCWSLCGVVEQLVGALKLFSCLGKKMLCQGV